MAERSLRDEDLMVNLALVSAFEDRTFSNLQNEKRETLRHRLRPSVVRTYN